MGEQSWLINLLAAKGEDDFAIAMDMEDWLVEHGVLVPDTRLQAIKDAPKCEHGNVYRHVQLTDTRTFIHCGGAPELAALLDVLAEETTISEQEKVTINDTSLIGDEYE